MRRTLSTHEPRPAPSLRALLAAAAALALAAASPARAGTLEEGNDAFRRGDHEEAARLYEESEDEADRLVRRFNAGVSWLAAGSAAEALKRFEDVSVPARGELRAAALYNAGVTQFTTGKGLSEKAREIDAAPEKRDERIAALAEAARAYHAALDFLRRVEPLAADDLEKDTLHNIAVAKTALRATLDEIQRLEEEKRREKEEEALASPPELLRELQGREKLHRAAARSLAGGSGKAARLGSRRLRKAEAESRGLAAKLLQALRAPPAPPPQQPATAQPGAAPPPAPEPSAEETARKEHAASALEDAVRAMEDAEIAYSKIDPASAVSHHTRAVAGLRAAREAFELDIGVLAAEAISVQEAVNQGAGALAAPAAGPTGLGGRIASLLEDKVLQPIARLLDPKRRDEIAALADEEDDVVWASGLLERAKLPPPPADSPAAAPGAPGGAEAPRLTSEMLEELNRALLEAGKEAREASTAAREHLAADRVDQGLEEGKKALAALQRIENLLPRPPEPVEERLRKLIESQRSLRAKVDGLASLGEELQDGTVREDVRSALEDGTREDGKEAGEVAAEVEKRQDEPAKLAAPKVREGESEIYAAAEALRKGRETEASEAIGRDITALEEALAHLSGEGGDEKEEGQEEDQGNEKREDQEGNGSKENGSKEEEREQGAFALSPSEARREQQRMDQDRRAEEARIFAGSSTIAVEKDW